MMRRSATLLAMVASVSVPAAAQRDPAPAPPPYPQEYRLRPFTLPDPGGDHGIGTIAFTVASAASAPLRVIAWYPSDRMSGPTAPYLTPAEAQVQAPAVARNFQWPRALLADVAGMPTHAHRDAPVAAGRFPLVIFNHGLMSYPRQNTALMEWLAARGYIVMSLAHPGDGADLPTEHGTIATLPAKPPTASVIERLQAFWMGKDHRARTAALPRFWEAVEESGTVGKLGNWRRDTTALVDAVASGRVPVEARAVARASDVRRMAFAGMSFGGSTAVSACQIDRRCRAAINLDGYEFDRRLYNTRLRMPLLLIQSDWTVFPNMGPARPDRTIYDYAYERWNRAGKTGTIHRYRLVGVRHLGLTDLALAPADPVRDRMFGPADGRTSNAQVADLVTAFLGRYVAGTGDDIRAAAARHPGVVAHTAAGIIE